MIRSSLPFVALCAAMLAAPVAPPLAAQEADDPASGSTNAIVVTAQRSGAPMWTIETAQGTVILVGEIRNIPESTPWQPDRLREATAEASRVILRVQPKVSPGDILRLIFKGGSITRLPDKTVAADYLEPALLARLTALEAQYKEDYSRKSFLITAFDFLRDKLRMNRDTTDSVTDVVKKAASKAGVPTDNAGQIRGKEMIDSLLEAEPAAHIPCLEAAITAAEIGPELVDKRGADWRAFRIPEVMNNPLEVALGRCWPWADPDVGNELRGIWVQQITAVTKAKGVTLAVVPLVVLAEEGGVLDSLEAQGLPIGGPVWRK